ncbi:MAG: hypothetical protein O2910_06745, partial [Proteobacteria bacterium]|nr:hypothetical protein [Pseudomonadota bacterium]
TLARPTSQKSADFGKFIAYGIPTDELPDPVARSIEGLLEHLHRLSVRIEELEDELRDRNCLPGSGLDDEDALKPLP